jgi:peptidyl-prolyl cis-trans isomerase D
MLQFFRNILGSKFGAALAVLFLVLIALAFAGTGVSNMFKGSSGKSSPTDAVATIGDVVIDQATLRKAANAALQNVREQQPTMSMQAFVAAGQLDVVLDNLIDRAAMLAWGKKHGIVISDRLVDSEIAKMAPFQGPDGKFSQTLYRQLLQQRGISEALIRGDIAQTQIARSLLVPASFGATMPASLATQYAQLFKEKREGMIAVLPAPLFAPAQPPSDKVLADWYGAHRGMFIRPERRAIRYAVLNADALKNVSAPTDAEIAARYKADAAKYAAIETRTVTQLVMLGEADAKAAAAEAAQGKPLSAIAQAKGLTTSAKGPLAKDALAGQTSAGIADAVFAAAKGGIVGPLRSPLGWAVLRVDAVAVTPARSLEQVKGEIAAALTDEKRRAALSAATSQIEDGFDKGTSLADTAKPLGLQIAETAPLTADGHLYDDKTKTAPPELARVMQTAFSMEQEHQPQLAETDPGKQYVMFEVSKITPSAPAPFAEIKKDVAAAYGLDQGNIAAGAAAKKVLAQVKSGSDLAKALASLGRPLPPPQPLSMTREQLAQMQQQSRQPIPPPLGLLFSMSQGTTKLLPAPGNRGWFVVSLKSITPGTLAPNDPLIANAQHDLGEEVGNEYADALRRAIRAEIGATKNPAAFASVKRELSGATSEP